MNLKALAAGASLLFLPQLAAAQMVPSGSDGLGEVMLFGEGWGELNNVPELLSFVLDAITTLILAAAIAHHPVRLRAPLTLESVALPRLFYLYALVGMAVGFLVVNHGYVIGFVVFGIGSLLRFRSNMDDPVDTVEMILVTVLGLCVGMDLPVMALLIGAISWIVILISARHAHFLLTLKGEDEANLDAAMADIEALAKRNGWHIERMHRSHTKPTAEVLFRKAGPYDEAEIETNLGPQLNAMPLTWKVEG